MMRLHHIPVRFILSLILTAFANSSLRAEEIDIAHEDAAHEFGLSRNSETLPPWAKPTTGSSLRLSEQARRARSSIFQVGHPDGGHGTAFVISKKNRLLATNAHVADIMHEQGKMFAIANESSKVFEVDKVWYHPGTIRKIGDEYVRSAAPRVGEIYARCPDVAVLRLKGDDELPDELPLATKEELLDVYTRPVAMMGYAGFDTKQFEKGETPMATYHVGVISRVTDFNNDASVIREDAQRLSHTMESWPGFSGSPMILPNGRVVGLNNSGKTEVDRGRIASLSWGVRIDCLFELLTYHDLTNLVNGDVSVDSSRLLRFEGPDPGIERIKRAKSLSFQAEHVLQGEKDYARARQLINQAVNLAPNEPMLRHVKSQVLIHSYIYQANTLTRQTNFEYKKEAALAAEIALRLDPKSGTAITTCARARIELLLVARKFREITKVRDALLEFATEASYSRRDRSRMYHTAAIASYYLGDFRHAYDCETSAITLFPFAPYSFSERAKFAKRLKIPHESDANRAEELQTAVALHSKAALACGKGDMRICLDYCEQSIEKGLDYPPALDTAALLRVDKKYPGLRDVKKAINYSTMACRLTDWKDPRYLDTLAKIHADNKDFDTASEWQRRAVELSSPREKSARKQRLVNYERRASSSRARGNSGIPVSLVRD